MAHLTVHFFSEVLGKCQTIEVILPQKTYGQIGLEGNGEDYGTYPVLYLLHGHSDDQTIWMRRTSIERYASAYNLAVVMPNADLSYYTDMACGPRYWTYISEELPQICRQFFPRISDQRKDTYAAGLSMGGYGAFKLALRHPERFAAAASLSGVLDITYCKQADRNSGYSQIFGDLSKLEGSDNDLLAVASRLPAGQPVPRLFACVGTEDFLYENNRTALRSFQESGIPVTYEEGPGSHTWEFWDHWIQRALEFFFN